VSQFFSAWHFDGVTAVRRTVAIEVDGPQFTLVESDSRASPARSGPFAFAELKAQNSAGAARTFGLNGRDGWRLGLEGPIPAELQAHLPAPEKYGRLIDRLGLGPASIVFALISVAAVAVVVWSPQWLAPLIPASVEQNLGDAMVGDFGGRFCATPEGTAALNKLTASLDQHPGDLQVEVANIDMINAVALPGNKVVLFNGLVAQAETPDEVAGVLAHEIGHVRQRHVMQGLLRQMGLAVVLGGFDGSGGSSINSLLSTTYTRGAEREADEHSLAAMKRADVSPVGTADFFRRLSAMDGSDAMNDKGERAMAGYLSSHPLSDERRQFFEKSLVKGKAYQPALSYDEWQELKTMCAKDKDVKSGWGFDMD
jgi:beta-barrel assembly-enhancing protease